MIYEYRTVFFVISIFLFVVVFFLVPRNAISYMVNVCKHMFHIYFWSFH